MIWAAILAISAAVCFIAAATYQHGRAAIAAWIVGALCAAATVGEVVESLRERQPVEEDETWDARQRWRNRR